MLAKCAEANALRKGWPEDFSGLYIAEEIDRAEIDQTATESAEQFEKDERVKRIAGRGAVPVIFNITDGLLLIPAGQFADKVLEHLRGFENPDDVGHWMEMNRAGLQAFWADNVNDALALKKEIEAIRQTLINNLVNVKT